MSEITRNISLNIYEPESTLKIYKDVKKKSIITKIIKNPDIMPDKKRIKEKFKKINENSNHLNEYNIFRRPGEKIFLQMKKKGNGQDEQKDDIIKKASKTDKTLKRHKNKKFLINRKQLEKINKKIPNNLYDYLHPYEYRYNLKKNNLLKNFLEMQISKIKDDKKEKNKEIKILKLGEDETNQNYNIIKYKSTNLILPLKNNLKTTSNKKSSIISKSLKTCKTMNNEIYNKGDTHKINKDDKIIRLKTSNEGRDYYYSDEDSSSLSFTEKINNNEKIFETNIKKKLYINGNEIDSYKNLLYFNTVSSKNINSKKDPSTQRSASTVRYNQKVFNRNNNIFTPYEDLKKLVFHSDCERTKRSLKKNYNFFHNTRNNNQNNISNRNSINRTQKIKINKEITQLNSALNEIKFYIISDKIDREKLTEKIDQLEKKMNYREDKVMIIKDILFEKLNNSDNQNDYINHAVNKNQYVNKLITSYGNTNEKKCEGLLDRKFMGGLKKLNNFGIKDAMIRNVIGENNYFIKHSINKIEEIRISKNRKNLGENTKKIKQLVKIIYNKKKNISEGYKAN